MTPKGVPVSLAGCPSCPKVSRLLKLGAVAHACRARTLQGSCGCERAIFWRLGTIASGIGALPPWQHVWDVPPSSRCQHRV